MSTQQKEKDKDTTKEPAKESAPAAAAGVGPEGEAAAVAKPRRERKERKPKANVQVWKLYKVSESSVERLRKECPRCGRGYFMAEHKDRLSCGHCGYATFRNRRSEFHRSVHVLMSD